MAALGGAAALAVGCNSDDDAANGSNGTPRPRRTPGPAGEPLQGGEITWGLGVAVGGIDPHLDLTGLAIAPLLYSYLYSWNPVTEEVVLNNFAEEFETPDPEHLQFIFTLRQGVKIHPGGIAAGEDLNSEDCKQSFIRRGQAITAPDKRFPNRIKGDRDMADALETPDPYTFRFTMSEPFVPSIREMANATWAIVPAKVMADRINLSQNAIGSGPFMLNEFRGSERIVLDRHPDYFLNPRPYLDRITYIVIQENSSLLSAFQRGQHDINGATLTKSDAENLERNDEIIVNSNPGLFYPVIHMKIRAPFDDIRVRRAVDRAIDRQELIDIIQEGEGVYNGPIQTAQGRWALPQEELVDFYRSDPDEARSLLSDAGYPNGFETRVKVPRLDGPNIVGDMANVLIAQLNRVGIRIQKDEVELGAFISSTLLPGNFDMAFFPNLPYDEPDRPLSFYHSMGVSGAGNWTNYFNPDVDELIEAQEREFDVETRLDIIHRVQRMILEEHGPQLTLVGGIQYSARWDHVHFASEFGEGIAEGAGPFGADIWTERG